jgi:parallel beta-helix repeat protein
MASIFSDLSAKTIHVPGDSTTIQGGINGAVDGDTVLVAPGIYHEHGIAFYSKAIAVVGAGMYEPESEAESIVDADSMGTVFHFIFGEDSRSVLTGFTITGGYAYDGGGILCKDYSSPTITNNVIVNNVAFENGGGIACMRDESSPVIRGNVITGNSTESWSLGEGGGIYCERSYATIVDNTILGNTSHKGGGIDCSGSYYSPEKTLLVEGNTITQNRADVGGGISVGSSCPVIRGNFIEDNSADSEGGGIWSYASPYMEVMNNYILSNTADGNGGGISFWDNSPEKIANNIFFGNVAANGGGGVYCEDESSPTMRNNTFVLNYASMGGGIYCTGHCSPALVNSILWYDSPQEIVFDGSGIPNTITISYSDLQGGRSAIVTNGNGYVEWLEGNIDTDPLFRDTFLADFHLKSVQCGFSADSPCIDAGDPAIADSLLDCAHGLGTYRSDMGAYGGRGQGPPLSIAGGRRNPATPPLPKSFTLFQNYPNPFNPSTTIGYSIPDGTETLRVRLFVYDIRGRLVRMLADNRHGLGHFQVHWDGRDARGRPVASGVYLYRVETDDFASTRKMLLIR